MRKLPILLLSILLLGFSGCASQLKNFDSNSNGWRPNDFDPASGVLLIEQVYHPKNQQQKIEAYMAKNYPHGYEFIDAKQLADAKYSDKTKYKFALVYSVEVYDIHQNEINRKPLNVTTFDYNFIDRVSNKHYPKSGIASSWASMTFKKIIETVNKH